MMILALASPYIHYSEQPITTWVGTWAAPLIIAMLAYGLFALFFTKKAKAAWPKSFLILAWACLGLTVASPYIEQVSQRQQRVSPLQPSAQTGHPSESPAPEVARQGLSAVDAEGKPCSQITEFLGECKR